MSKKSMIAATDSGETRQEPRETNEANEANGTGAAEGCRVYCGPSVRNVARQYTVYAGDIPNALREFIRAHPAAGGLLVPVERFAETRRSLETKGTAEAVLYSKVKSEL